MGRWSAGIIGSDQVMDLNDDYKAAFSYYSPELAIEKLDYYCENILDNNEIYEYYYSVAQFMWEHGILTQAVKDRALNWIDNEKGLELFVEAGESTLKKRRAVLQQLKEKLNSPLPPPKKIKVEPNTIFELGDMIAVQLSNQNLRFLHVHNGKEYKFTITPEMVEKYAGYYVVVKKIYNTDGLQSAVVPEVKDGLPVYVLYDYFDRKLPDEKTLKKMKILDVVDQYDIKQFDELFNVCETDKERSNRRRYIPKMKCAFRILNKTEFYWKKRNYKVVGNDLSDCKKIIMAIKKSMEHKEKWEAGKYRKDFPSPCTILEMDFDQFILRRLLLKEIIKQ